MLEQLNDIISVDELCEVLMIGKNSAYELLASGRLRAFRSGKRWKIPKLSVEQYIKKQTGL